MPIRSHPIPAAIHRPDSLARTDAVLKAHPAYRDAKAGSVEAATRLVLDLAIPFLVGAATRFPASAWFVAPHALEASGDNAIPQVLAAACSLASGGTLDNDIVQTTRVFHTGADPMERLAARPEFEGIVIPGASYVLVDDVTTIGSTLAELASYIQAGDAKVVGAIVLVNAGRTEEFHPPKTVLARLKARYDNQIEQIFGIRIEALTANEASYLTGFRSPDEIRNRLAKARQETDRRLRAKGIET